MKAQTLLLKEGGLSSHFDFIYLTCDATRPFPGEELTRGALNLNRQTSWPVAVVEEVETRAGGKAVYSWQTWGTLTLSGGRLHVKCQEERQKHEKLNKIEEIKIRDFYVVSSPSSSFRMKLTAVATHLETLDKTECGMKQHWKLLFYP